MNFLEQLRRRYQLTGCFCQPGSCWKLNPTCQPFRECSFLFVFLLIKMSKREIECKQKCPWFYPSVNSQIEYLDILADREHSVLSALGVHGEHWFSVGAVSERESKGGAARSVRLLWTLKQQLRRDAEGLGSVHLVFPAICGEGHRKGSISLQSIL